MVHHTQASMQYCMQAHAYHSAWSLVVSCVLMHSLGLPVIDVDCQLSAGLTHSARAADICIDMLCDPGQGSCNFIVLPGVVWVKRQASVRHSTRHQPR